jgi:hypothetical protein
MGIAAALIAGRYTSQSKGAEYEYEITKYEYDKSRFRGSSVAENLQTHFTLSLTSLHPFFNLFSSLNTRLNFLPAFKGLEVQIVTAGHAGILSVL